MFQFRNRKRTLETLREEHWLITLESRVLKKILGLRKGEEGEGCKGKKSNDELEDLYVS
jgi:hypothetical protein